MPTQNQKDINARPTNKLVYFPRKLLVSPSLSFKGRLTEMWPTSHLVSCDKQHRKSMLDLHGSTLYAVTVVAKSAAKLAGPLLSCSPHCLIFLECFFPFMKASRLLLITSYGYSGHSFVCSYYSSTQSIQLAFQEQCTGGHSHFPFFLTLYC